MILTTKNFSVGMLARAGVSILLASLIAACGGGGGSPGTVSGSSGSTATNVASVSLVFSSPELKSAGTAGTEVTVTAVAKNANNNTLENIPVTFTASSGVLMSATTVTDTNGQATASLGTSGDHSNRTITVTAVAGSGSSRAQTSGTVNVVGTSVAVVGPTTIASGAAGDFTITVLDSANAAVPNVPVSISSQKGNAITVETSGGGSASEPLTNSQGQVVIGLTASQTGADTLTVSSQGVSTTAAVNVNASRLTVAVTDSSGSPVTTGSTSTSCHRVTAHYEVDGVPQGGTVNISTSRGGIYADSTCAALMGSSSVALVAGDSNPVYLRSNTAGVATVTVAVANGPTAQTDVEFIAALTSSATISLQADPAIIGANTGSGQSEKSTLTAIVRDGTSNNNFVKNAVVEFSILNDKSGGRLSNPSVVTTGSNGAATATFIAGTADTPRDGVTIQAKIQGTSTSAAANLTVSRKSLFIAAGTGNLIGTPSSTTYQQDYTVFVTDASGNPVSGVTITASVMPTRYLKGTYIAGASSWEQDIVAICPNEDVNQNGILDASEDSNGNTILDPGIPLSVTSSGTTDANGTAVVSLLYPRDRGNWIEIQLTIRGSVSGTESTYRTTAYTLPVLGSDLASLTIAPPGMPSPFGVNACNLPN